jgi:hypothetical protein
MQAGSRLIRVRGRGAFTEWAMMRRLTLREYAGAGITAQFLALLRTLGEVFRLKYFDVARYTVAGIEPFVVVTAVLVAVAVTMFAIGRIQSALTIAVVNIVALFIYKVVFM